jgi:aminoglycoside phosphotransferase family enzyme
MAELPRHLAGLMSPTAYPHAVQELQLVETHISWVVLTGEYAYKIKRPVVYPFVDLRSAERRAFYCAEELRLNRRFAPDLYLAVCEVREEGGSVHIGGKGRIVEHCVKMRQFERSEE